MTETASDLPASETPSAPEAMERALDAAQRLLVERLELAGLDLQQAFAATLRTALLLAAMGLTAWATFVAGLVVALASQVPLAAACVVAAVVQVVLAAIVIAARRDWERKEI